MKHSCASSDMSRFCSILTLAFAILTLCWILFAIDKDMHQFSDLLKPGNLAALVVYFTPTFLVCLLLHHILSMKLSNTKSMLLSLILGAPVSFTGMIYLLS